MRRKQRWMRTVLFLLFLFILTPGAAKVRAEGFADLILRRHGVENGTHDKDETTVTHRLNGDGPLHTDGGTH